MGLSQTFEPYGEAGGWRVLANTKMQGCLIEKRLEDDVDLQIGINKVDARGYMAVFAPSSLGLVPAGGGEMVLDIDGDLYTGEAVEVDKPDYVGGYFWFNNPDFIYNLENKEVLGLVVETGTVVLVNLEGTKAGVAAVRQCQEEKFGS
ncbi:hypothetical protein ACW9UR_08575 [Halovulum sp. GXIMD14794]